MVKIYIILIILILLPNLSFSQENFYEGGYILSSGDSVHGYVEDLLEKYSINEIRFRENESSEIIILKPSMVSGVYILSHQKFLSFQPQNNILKKPYFFKIYVLGEISLIGLEPLKLFYSIKEGDTIEIKNEHILKVLLNESPQIVRHINDIAINKKNLTEFIKEYNYDRLQLNWFEKRIKSKIKINPGLMLGAGVNDYHYLNYFKMVDFDYKAYYNAGVSTEVIFPRMSKNNKVLLDIGFSKKLNYGYGFDSDNNKYYTNQLDYNAITFDLKRLRFSKKGSVYFSYGLSGNFLISNKSQLFKETVDDQNVVRLEIIDHKPPRLMSGINLGTGLALKSLNSIISINVTVTSDYKNMVEFQPEIKGRYFLPFYFPSH